MIHVVAHTIDDLTADLDLLSEDPLPEALAHADHVRSPLQSRRPPAARQPSPEFLANADEVKRGSHGEEYLRMSRAEREAQDKKHLQSLQSLRPKQAMPLDIVTGPGRPKREQARSREPVVPGRGTHPRNVRVIPKSRDFH